MSQLQMFLKLSWNTSAVTLSGGDLWWSCSQRTGIAVRPKSDLFIRVEKIFDRLSTTLWCVAFIVFEKESRA